MSEQRWRPIKEPVEMALIESIIVDFKRHPKGERSFWSRLPKNPDLPGSYRVVRNFLKGRDGKARLMVAADIIKHHHQYHQLWSCSYNTRLLELTSPLHAVAEALRKVEQKPLRGYEKRALLRAKAQRKREKARQK